MGNTGYALEPWYNPLPPTSAATASPTGLPIFLGGNDPVFNRGFVPLLPFIAMLGPILAFQGMKFPTEIQALLFLRNARKPSVCQSPVFVELLLLRNFMTLVSGV